MEYKLSPSSLNLLEDCPRCFWLAQIKKIKRPSGAWSSIPVKMDSIIKHYFNKYRELNELPPILEGRITGRLAIDMPKTLRYAEENGIMLWGRPDDYFELEDNYVIPLDHKTASKPPEKIHFSYHLQLNVYSYLLKMMGFKTTNRAYLAYYSPSDCDLHNGMCINCTVIEMKTNPMHAKELVKKAYHVLNDPMPKSSEKCEYCKWAEEISLI